MRKSLKTRIVAMALAVCSVLGMCVTAQASSIADGSKTATIGLEERHTYLTTTAGTTLGATSYEYKTNDGLTGPAYCIDHGLAWTNKPLPITGKYTANPQTAGVFANGSPQHSLETFKGLYQERYPILAELTNEEYRYATQIAVWSSLGQIAIDGTAFTEGRERVAEPSGDLQQLRVFRAIQCILGVAKDWTKVYQAGMYIRCSENAMDGDVDISHGVTLEAAALSNLEGIKLETINGKNYYTKEYIFASATSTYYQDYTIDVWATDCPAGTMFTDMKNVELVGSHWKDTTTWRIPVTVNNTNLNYNGFEYSGHAKLCIPADNAPPSGKITIHSAAQIMQYEIYLANNETAYEQSYIIADPSKGTLEADAVLMWGGELTETGRIQITKVGPGGNPLKGAEFTLTGTDGSTRTGKTDNNGVILWERLKPGITYTLTETNPPAGYGIVAPSTLNVTAAKTTFLTVRDDPAHTLTVHKIDRQNGYSLRGAVICLEQIDGSFKTSGTTDHAGNIQFDADQLPLGSYKVYEAKAPEGYELDSTAQTVHWDGLHDVTLTFSNVRQKTLIISKKDSRTGYNLPDATFQVFRDGQLVTTVTTGDSGLAYVHDVKEGYYEVKETIAPSGYSLNNKVYGVNIDPYDPTTTDDPRLVVANDPLPGLRVIKYDQQTKKPLANVTFKVYKDTTLLGTYTTNSNGEIVLSALEPGTYLVEEVAAPDTHVVNSTPQQIELKAGQAQNATLIFFNSMKPGMHLVKVDSETLKPLPNATYLISQVGGSYSKEFVTDANGEIDLSKLDPGTYTVKETKAPEGYLIDDGARIIKLNAGEDAQFVFTDTPKPSLTVVKYDPNTGDYLAGATFRIAKVEDGSHYLDRVSDTNGRITITALEPGVYSVQELAAPSGYVLNTTEYHVELFPGKESQLVVTNEAKPDLRIVKTDAITGEPVQGVTFTIKMADGRTITTEATDSNGEIFLADMEPGVVEIWEQSVPSNYLLNEEHQLITLVPNKLATVQFQNYPKPGLTIYKVDSVTGDPIKGAKFSITYASSNTFTGEINSLGNFTSDENGMITLTNLEDGWYKITETEPAPGYSMKEPTTQEIYIKAGTSKSVTFENIPLSALVVYKYDSVTGEAVSNAVFQVKYLAGGSGTGGTVIGTYKTSVNGSFTVTGLKVGTYIVEELASDSNHVIDTAPQTAYISGKDQDVVELYFGNAPKGSLTVKKIDSVTHKPLSDVEFMVTYADGSVVGDANGKFVTDSAGSFTISGINPGSAIVVKEVRAKEGYVLDDTPQTITIRAGQAATLEFRNAPMGALVITKMDADTKKPLAGATFKVTTSDGTFVAAQGGAVSSNGLYTTDKEGQIVLTGLAHNTYVVTETSAPKGYTLNSKPQTVQVNANDTQTLYFYNERIPEGDLRIVKLDEETRQPIKGVEFAVSHMNGKRVGTYRTDAKGIIHLNDLTPGWYTVVETKAADNYALDAEPHDIQVKKGETVTLEITNRLTGSALIHKVDSVTGKGIYGVTFLVSDSKGNPVGQYTSDQDGYVYVNGELADGKYTIREIQQADGYLPDTTVKTIWIEYGGCSMVTWKNTPITGQIQVTKSSADLNTINGWPAGTPIPGTEFEVYNKAGVLVDTIRTDKNGVAATKALPLGRYTLIESKAADYYALDKTPIVVDLEFAGQIVRVAVSNKSLYTNVSIEKTGYVEVMPGQAIRYTFSGIANNSTTALTSFYWRDTLPVEAVRLSKIITGTYNAPGNYKIVFKTNLSGDYRTLADSLNTQRNYTLDASPMALRLASNEYVTEVMFVFGTVPANFRQVETPFIDCTVVSWAQGGSQFVNQADVGGVYNGQWVQATTRWVTKVYAPAKPLPRTGY